MDSALVDCTSEQFLGRWKRLVSTTNWEKGRIIYEWREALVAAEAPLAEYSDEAWSRRVGNVTPQHVGRLRRVFESFAAVHDDYPGLYWSHFQAALDWDDAPMWLTGAVDEHRAVFARGHHHVAAQAHQHVEVRCEGNRFDFDLREVLILCERGRANDERSRSSEQSMCERHAESPNSFSSTRDRPAIIASPPRCV